MSTLGGFTRQEVIELTGASSNILIYLEKSDLVTPERFGNPKKPVCIYTLLQLLQIMLFVKLKEQVSISIINQLFEAFTSTFHNNKWDLHIVLIGHKISFVKSFDEITKLFEEVKKCLYLDNFLIVPLLSIDGLIDRLRESIKTNEKLDIISFEKRVKMASSQLHQIDRDRATA